MTGIRSFLRFASILSLAINLPFALSDTDINDFSDINNVAAIGDSYSAGIGAGNRIDKSCSRYDSAYPYLLVAQLGKDMKDVDFTFTACSGAKVPQIIDQANALKGGHQIIMISAGGNDAGLATALNDCVFTFKGLFSSSCSKTLDNVQEVVDSDKFASSIDNLISIAKGKLASKGHIYYTGYAQFFDATTTNCDKVSWHVWVNLFSKQYLTKANRDRMNKLVIAMNSKLRDAVSRAGDQVTFVDYDYYVGYLGGRYCLPGVDEDNGNGANRPYLFFYEMKTQDTPFLAPNEDPFTAELRRRDEATVDPGDTLDGEMSSWIEETLKEHPDAQLNDDVANSDFDSSVAHLKRLRRRAPIQPTTTHRVEEAAITPHDFRRPLPYVRRRLSSSMSAGNSSSGMCASGTASGTSGCTRGTGSHTSTTSRSSKSSSSSSPPFPLSSSSGSSRSLLTASMVSRRPRGTGFPSGVRSSGIRPSGVAHSSASYKIHGTGTAAASASASGLSLLHKNGTEGIFLNKGVVNSKFEVSQKSSVLGYLVPDSVSRVFHPQQAGHAMIAGLIFYNMAAQKAKSAGLPAPPEKLQDIGDSCPLPTGQACNNDGTDTWTARDLAKSGATSFCTKYKNLFGKKGATTSGTFNGGSLDYMSLSIEFKDDFSIAEPQCEGWFGTVIDGCNTGSNGNFKHGGSIDYGTNATLHFDPLVVRRIWDGGKPTFHTCNGVDNNHYVTQSTLAQNIKDYCTASVGKKIGLADTTFSKDFNDGTPDKVTLSTYWPKGKLNYQIFEDECTYYLNTIANGCDVPSSDSNPLNWKHGGEMKSPNGIVYNIKPVNDRADPPNKTLGTCTSWYKVLWATFDVYGGGWSDGDWGQDRLLKEIKGCGAVTNWQFEYYDKPHDDGTEWHASGRLPIGTRGCVGRAVTTSGGFTGGCGGNG